MATRSEKVTFPGAAGGSLAGRIDWPVGAPRAFGLFAHCFTCSHEIFAAERVSRGLAGLGFAVLRFDFTGLGASEGEFANTGFSSNVADLIAAADFLRAQYQAPKLLVGHSLGGAAVLKAAADVPEVAAVATINAPSDPEHVKRAFKADLSRIESDGEADVTLAGRKFRITREFLEDIEGHALRDAIGKLGKALLVFHAPRDGIVSIDNASAIFTAARHPKSFVSLDDADHLLTRREDATYVANVLAAWAGRYLPQAEVADESQSEVPQGEVLVREAGEGTFPQLVSAGKHRLRADEPESVGGTDTGPDPYSFLLTALGSCTAMTIRLYADRKKYPLEHVKVRLQHAKIHASDCSECETKEGKLDRIEREIELSGPLDEDQRADLLRIADRCPVHRTLHGEILVTSRLV
jgi:putative redox protein